MKNNQTVFSRNVIEFITVASEFCKFMEQADGKLRDPFVDTTLKLLPLLYLKSLLLPPLEPLGEEGTQRFVTEETYEVLRITLGEIMGDRDAYLDVFVKDMRYSDQPIKCSVGEGLADIYQSLKDCVSAYALGGTENMHEALAACREEFIEYWGQTLVNTLRALHEIKFNSENDDD
ncbi:MAG: DUF5063 domain-containing protein [Prevotellaceae bacterium]|jgi:hypothetical protein|nr:DUF5063 domain-containing protein [Prevotellaceae bacterium]